MSPASRFLVISGATVVVFSVGWWWLTYADVIRYAYLSPPNAGLCLVSNSDICQLAKSLCRGAHPFAIIGYRSASIWIGAALLCASLVTATARDA
ncbi:hypothetical protein [Labrys monachus]|uniref:Uncharacterized protein n=1 Tax=Labrys monachus TaxID=217067 RepID=A0ABU0FHX3_9HYPH|nr:hypothetical protein [Labrys monachus]MDQ0394209.1 hypothetical protein [Labrys monachus]